MNERKDVQMPNNDEMVTVEEFVRARGLDLTPEQIREFDAYLEAHCQANGIPYGTRYVLSEDELHQHSAICGCVGYRDACTDIVADFRDVREAWDAGQFEEPSAREVLDTVQRLVQRRLDAIVRNLEEGRTPEAGPPDA